uniref:Uncharacterized protein n=1 Tax=Megaselia scalaris TaxID=36166 RepID=T1H2L1_MEGSC
MYFKVILIALLSFSNAERLENCKVGHKFGNTTMAKFKLSDFENNKPRSTEVLRTKVYFKYSLPVFSIFNSPTQFTFGAPRLNTTFGIYKSHRDYKKEMNPCSSVENITYFSGTQYVGAVFILES